MLLCSQLFLDLFLHSGDLCSTEPGNVELTAQLLLKCYFSHFHEEMLTENTQQFCPMRTLLGKLEEPRKSGHVSNLSSLPNPARKKVSQGRGPGAGGEPSEVYEVTPISAAGKETLTEDTQLNAQGQTSMPSERPGGGSSVKRC